MRLKRRFGLRRFAGLTVTAAVIALAVAGIALGVTGAISTTDNPTYTGPDAYANQACLNGTGVNCNIYQDKRDVWFSGLPVSASLGAGTYFFAVLSPGGQPAPNDLGTNNSNGDLANLSDDVDAYTNRTFTVDGSGNITSYGGTHNRDGNLLQVFDFADTPNNGGVYILAVCSLSGGYPVAPRDCKYDAFKVKEANPPETPPAAGATVTKTADGAYNTTWTWDASKTVDKTLVTQIGGSATFNYTVTVTHDNGTNSDVKVTGTISVFNPNVDQSNNTVPMDIDSLTDSLSDNTSCTVTGAPSGGNVTLTTFQTDFPYECDLNSLPQGSLDNTVTVGWPAQDLNLGGLNLSSLTDGTSDFTFSGVSFTQTKIDDSVVITDTFGLHGTTGTASTLGTVYSTDASPKTFTYARVIAIPAHGCLTYDNLANFTTNTTSSTDGTPGDNAQSVTVCGPANTGALTMGFWKGPNGQGLISSYGSGLYTWLHGLGPNASGPFSTVNSLSDINAIFKAASATNMNAMLRAQMLATALDYYFGTDGLGWSTTAIGKIKPPSGFLIHNGLFNFTMDMTSICPMVDNLSTGTATCTNNKPSTNGYTAGAFPSASMSALALLNYEASNPPYATSGSPGSWYAGNRTKEEIAKNAFDQINNGDAFAG